MPHIGFSLWHSRGFAKHYGDILDAPWPAVDAAALVRSQVELMLQINGKLRGSVTVAADADRAIIEAAAAATEVYGRYSEGKAPKKIIVVPGRLINVVF